MNCKQEDIMLAELRQIKTTLWDESGHDIHRLAEIVEKEARKAMNRIGKHPIFLSHISSPANESVYREISPNS